jgi:hypothetical protein
MMPARQRIPLGNPGQLRNQVGNRWGILLLRRHHPAKQVPETPSTQTPLTTRSSHFIGAFRKGRGLNSGKCATFLALYVYCLTFYHA